MNDDSFIDILRRKLAELQKAEAITADASQRFQLQEEIKDVKLRIDAAMQADEQAESARQPPRKEREAQSRSAQQKTVRLIRVFVSSPGDVEEERSVLDEVIDRINKTDGRRDGVRLESWTWEDAIPQIGPKAQDVIDVQTPSHDIYLGIMAHRFGSPTGRYGSGTEKEFKAALRKWGKHGTPWILFYFSEAKVDPFKLDAEQLAKVTKFRQQVEKKGLYATYDDVRGSKTAFFEQVDDHLRKIIPRLLQPVAEATPKSKQKPQRTPSKKQPAKPDIPQLYLDWLKRECADVDLLGLRVKEGRSLKLDTVYVPLTTQAREKSPEEMQREEGQKNPQLLLDLLDKQPLYVSGDPGSGKSTFCRWIAWLACAGSLPSRTPPEPEGYQEAFPESFRERLPLLVRLRDFWPFLPENVGESLSQPRLEESLAAWLAERNQPGLEWSTVEAHLRQGTTLLIFDGVDEVPVSNSDDSGTRYPRRLLISGLSSAIAAWTGLGNRLLLTSRPYGLDETDRQHLPLLHAPIQGLVDHLQNLLVHRWFSILRDNEAEGEMYATDMLDDLRGRSGVAELAANPMLLTAMCIIYNEGKRLPQDRCDLYTRIVDNVLYSRFKVATEIEMVRNELCVVAHAMHAGIGDGRKAPRAQVKYDEIDRSLEKYREQRRWTQAGFEDLLQRREQLLSQTGLLLPRGDSEAAFYHLSIQEFLAAQRLWALESDNLVQVFVERAEVPEWRNTLSFLFGTQLSRIAAPEPSIRLLEKLIEKVGDEQLGLQVVLGDCLQILLGKGIRLPRETEDKYRQRCVDAIEREVSLRERNLLGLALGWIGDPRIVMDLRDEAAYIKIPASTYPYQDGKQEIKKPFLLSKYPVTNGQFKLFVDDGGYQKREWWSEKGWAWRDESKVSEPGYWHSGKWNTPNQSVVGVSYWEAEAFAAWAGSRLPTEHEWEAAAQGPEGHEYPWGDEWEDGICNSREAELGMTSPVGLFPRSRSVPFGLEDLAGNVDEWCQGRVLRGGSWDVNADNCRCSSRVVIDPIDRVNDVGFRLARTYP